MAKGANQKLKLLYLLKILWERTDDDHGMTMSEIIGALTQYDVQAERKSIYADMEALRRFGIDVIGEVQGRQYVYHLGSRMFEMAELKLLVDSVQAAKFITAQKTETLIRKLERLVSNYEAGKLQRQVYVSGRIKADNEAIYYNVDKIHAAIADNKMISFQYFQWNEKKEQEPKGDGKPYHISPWALSWDDENYYLVGYDGKTDSIKHYRVDKMQKISLMGKERQGRDRFAGFDMAAYAKKMFGMFAGKECRVNLVFENRLANVVIDRFGKDVTFFKVDEEHFQVNVYVAVSRQFLGWVMSLGSGVKITGPKEAVAMMREEVTRLWEEYRE